MKTQTIKNILTVGLGLLLSTQVLVGCAKKESGSSKRTPIVVNPNPWGPGACATCAPGTGVLARTTSEASIVALNANLSIMLDLYGQNMQAQNMNIPNMNMQDPKLITYYYGGVVANGQLTINGSNGQCGVTPGVYTISTVQPGQIGMGVISGLKIHAINGTTRIAMTVMNGILYNSQDPNGTNSTSSTNRMGGDIMIENITSSTNINYNMYQQGGCMGTISLY